MSKSTDQYVFVIPTTLKGNPYLERLYSEIDEKTTEGTIFHVRPFSFRALWRMRLEGKQIIVHIHWETNIYGSKYWAVSLARMFVRFPLFFFARICGVKFVWTLHNRKAHDYPYPLLDSLGRALMWQLAHAVIIQNQTIARTYRARPKSHVSYVPHGNYQGAYGVMSNEGKPSLRFAFDLPQDAFVLLALGTIRPYKRLELLIDAVREAAHTNPRISLVIAGKGEKEYVETLRARSGSSSNIHFIPKFIPDSMIPKLLQAADYAVIAHGDSSLTSGAVILALSYGLPVVTTDMPARELIVQGENGYIAEDETKLAAFFAQLEKFPRPSSDKVLASIKSADSAQIGKDTMVVYRDVISRK